MADTPPPGRLAGTARVGDRGHLVIPQDIRDLLGIAPGDVLLLLADVGRGIAIVGPEELHDFTDRVFGDLNPTDPDAAN